MSKKVFMGGICGMGMCPLALFLREDGCDVSGFDDNQNPGIASLLKSAGVRMVESKKPECGVDEFIITSALARKSSELNSLNAGKFLRRGEALAEICKSRRLIAVCGSHGKTTTSALLAHAINSQNLDAGYMVGAIPSDFSPVRHCNDGKLFAAEIDESDATIENFSPHITLALNGDLDHIDTYPDAESLKAMFRRLFSRTRNAVIIPENDSLLNDAANGIAAEVIRVKVPQNDFLLYDKRMALAALGRAFTPEFDESVFDGFAGVARRQETIADTDEILAIADYAHHPFEVESFLEWLDGKNREPKLLFFQPHRYTRTKRFGSDFKALFEKRAAKGDSVWILPVYAASEIPDARGMSKNIAGENVCLAEFSEMPTIIEKFKGSAEGKPCVAFIGAGDIYFEALKLFEYEKI